MNQVALVVLVAAPWLGMLLLLVARTRWQRAAWVVALAAVLCSIASSIFLQLPSATLAYPGVPLNQRAVSGLFLFIMLDEISWPFLFNILVISLFAVLFARGYMQAGMLHHFYALLLGFIGGMIGIVVARDGFLFFVFWESVLVTSSLLIAGWGEGAGVGRIVLKYFMYTQAGSLLVLVGLAAIAARTGSSNMTHMLVSLPNLAPIMRERIALLMTLGFCVKLAIFPLHAWLPDAHSVAPMPVTILLASCMLSLGAYGILRFPLAILGPGSLHKVQFLFMLLGLSSGIYGALMCLATQDIKRLVAYSSVSQMGYILFGLATLTPIGSAGSIFHLLSHGVLKALLFMGVGLVIRSTARRRLDELGGLYHTLPRIMAVLGLGTLALAGMPPFIAFHSEWMILAGGITSRYPILGYIQVSVPLLTALYALYFVYRLAFGPMPADLHLHPSNPLMRWPFYILLILALVLGLFPQPLYTWAERAVALIGAG